MGVFSLAHPTADSKGVSLLRKRRWAFLRFFKLAANLEFIAETLQHVFGFGDGRDKRCPASEILNLMSWLSVPNAFQDSRRGSLLRDAQKKDLCFHLPLETSLDAFKEDLPSLDVSRMSNRSQSRASQMRERTLRLTALSAAIWTWDTLMPTSRSP